MLPLETPIGQYYKVQGNNAGNRRITYE